jgi:hypothetical protein
VIFEFLSRRSYWAQGITRDRVERALVARVGPRGEAIGFARAVTDRATFAYLCDVFVIEPERGRGVAAPCRLLRAARAGGYPQFVLGTVVLTSSIAVTASSHSSIERNGIYAIACR